MYISMGAPSPAENTSNEESAAMKKLRKKDITWLLFWLLVFVPIKPFYSERPYSAVQPPLTRGDIGSNHPQAHIYHGLSCGEDHMNATLARADVTRWLNPAVVLVTLANMAMVAVIMVMVVYVFIMATFWCCHVAVHWAIAGRYIRLRINDITRRYTYVVITMNRCSC